MCKKRSPSWLALPFISVVQLFARLMRFAVSFNVCMLIYWKVWEPSLDLSKLCLLTVLFLRKWFCEASWSWHSPPPPAPAFPTSLLNNRLFPVHSPSLKWKELALLLMIIFKLQNFNSISVANKWKLCILFNVFQKIPAIFFSLNTRKQACNASLKKACRGALCWS